MQHNANGSQEKSDSMYMNVHEIVADYGTTTTKGDNEQKDCVDYRRKGEPIMLCEVDDTDVGDV